MEAAPSGFRVLYESDEVLVVSKPHDVAMDGDRADDTVEKWVHREQAAYLARPLPLAASPVTGGGQPPMRGKTLKWVHQLDYATSGVLCLAFSRDMASRLCHCFAMRETRKEYAALLVGWVPDATLALNVGASEQGVTYCSRRRLPKDVVLEPVAGSLGAVAVDASVGADDEDEEKFRMMVDGPSAKDGLTVVSVLGRGYLAGTQLKVTKVHLRLFTGRRHQLRVHCAVIGHPIVGDATYTPVTPPRGVAAAADAVAPPAPRMMLHAQRLRVDIDIAAVGALSLRERIQQKRKRRRIAIGSLPGGAAASAADGAAPQEDDEHTVFDAGDDLAPFFAPARD
jgi:23S rRNA-/tRNA-specific pseudouridylate synthase